MGEVQPHRPHIVDVHYYVGSVLALSGVVGSKETNIMNVILDMHEIKSTLKCS